MLFLQGSCQSPSGNKTCDQIIIDLDNNIKKLHHLSDILDIEEFIYLKGHEIASVDEVIYHHDKIVILDKDLKEICCYSTAGEYLYSIGRKGRGPQEFINPIDISITNSGLVYILDDTLKILVYNVDGTFNKVIKLPTFFSEMHAIDDNNIALLHASDGKCAKYELTIISSKGKVKSTFLPIPENRIDIPYGYKKSFRYFDGETHFILPFDNSIYALEGKEVKPIFRVQYKKMATRDIIERQYKNKLKTYTWLSELEKEYATNFWHYLESRQHISFSYAYNRRVTSVFYNKKTKCVNTYNYANLHDPLVILSPVGFKDQHTLVNVLKPYSFKMVNLDFRLKLFANEDPELSERLKDLTGKLKVDDNPVLVVTRIKES